MPQNDTYLRQIQSNLNKKKVNGRKLKTVSFAEIRKVIIEEFPSVDYEAMTKQEKESIVAYIHEQRVKTVNTIERHSNSKNSDSYNIELAAKMESQEIENPQLSSDIEKNLSSIENPLLSSEIESNLSSIENPLLSSEIENNSSAMEVADASTELITTQPTELSVTKTDNNSVTKTDNNSVTKTDINSVTKTDINQLAPHEAITLIQEIADYDTSRNKQVASQLLTQLDNKTDSIVALVAAMPDIEAEMLRRKLKQIDRKEVDYEAIIGSHFQKNTTELTSHISSLAAEYGVTL
ncbi:MAG: hypothetical protein ACFCUV_03365 [Rivularia sp. (in: cyanobacteria)]